MTTKIYSLLALQEATTRYTTIRLNWGETSAEKINRAAESVAVTAAHSGLLFGASEDGIIDSARRLWDVLDAWDSESPDVEILRRDIADAWQSLGNELRPILQAVDAMGTYFKLHVGSDVEIDTDRLAAIVATL